LPLRRLRDARAPGERPSCQRLSNEVYLIHVKKEVHTMVNRVNTLSVYVPKNKMTKRPVERLAKLAEVKERSINYLVVEAILQFLDREEKKK